jgi:uncharacterized protein (TIGR00297 family)
MLLLGRSRLRLNVAQPKLAWQSKLVLLLVVPFAAAYTLLQAHWWANQAPAVAIWTLGLSLLLAIIVLWLHAATPAAAFAGFVITASLMFSTVIVPYQPWRTALVPTLGVSLFAYIATRFGRRHKEQLGTAEMRHGRAASQIAANLGIAMLVSNDFFQSALANTRLASRLAASPGIFFVAGLSALAEAAADTVSSEVGQVLGGRPHMITTLLSADPGTDGAISLAGTLAGISAAALISAAGALAVGGGLTSFCVATAGAVFGLLFDSLLGATLERHGLLNNDAVNFLSTASAAAFALGLLALLPETLLR